MTTYVYKTIQALGRKMAEKLSAVFSAISLGQISKIKQINYTENGQSLDTKKPSDVCNHQRAYPGLES